MLTVLPVQHRYDRGEPSRYPCGACGEGYGKKVGKGVPTFGCLDSGDGWVFEPRFDEVLFFSSGLAPVKERGLRGYILPDGTYIIPPAH